MMKKLSLLLLPLMFVAVGCEQYISHTEDDDLHEREDSYMEGEMMEEMDDNDMEEKKMMKDEPSDPRYQMYDAEKYAELRGTKPFVLFFYAEWCPTCRNWEAKMKENLDELPENTLILQADYDTQEALKQEFEINKQSTAVLFDEKGNMTGRVMDPSIETLKAHFQLGMMMEDEVVVEDPATDSQPEAMDARLQGSEELKAMIESSGEAMYEDFSQAEYDEFKGSKKFVVFFYADWCPTCRNWDQKLREGLGSLDSSVLVLKADYDAEEDLKKELGVTKQSTAVFFNADGTVANVASDPDLATLEAHFVQ